MHSKIARAALIIVVAGFGLAAARRVRAQNDAAKAYKANCVMCHAANGSGDAPAGKALKAKDLRTDQTQKKSDSELADTIAKGKGKMPAFGAKLSPDLIKSLVAYVRDLAKK
ncbi:MAG TPA: cytochrome c [Candidatus Acidoferrales bacterium]|nr:cytochrome c [Candidatus Acidoferrales bacterium]